MDASSASPAAPRSALVLGATGLVGAHALDLLLGDDAWGRVVVLARRAPERAHPKLEARAADFDRLGDAAGAFRVDDVFCALGTTIAKAGSQEAFRRVDFGYVAEAARLAAAGGARRFLLVSAMGADAGSRIFYNRVKGEAERAVSEAGVPGVAILRPSLLLGHRDERRPGEALAQRVMPALSFLLIGPLRKYRAVEGAAVARALVRLAKAGIEGVRVVESDEIARLGGSGG